MKKFLQIFFMILGIIFFLLIIAGIYLYVADPYGIKPLLQNSYGQPASTTKNTNNAAVDKNPMLSPAQEQALEKVGIDPAKLPTQITPAMEACFYAKLGEKRANEIKNGAEPTANDYLLARSCAQ